jgi:hypothetical protein
MREPNMSDMPEGTWPTSTLTAKEQTMHYPISDTSLECVCGWRPPNQERWRQQMRLDEHLRYMAERPVMEEVGVIYVDQITAVKRTEEQP